MITIGIDPGLSGAIALLDHSGQYIAAHDMPTMARGEKKKQINPRVLRDTLQMLALAYERNETIVMIEHVNAMPGQGVTSMFNLGHSCGLIEGVVAAMGFSYELVTSQAWKKDAGLIGKDKDASRTLVTRLYPTAPVHLVKHDGRADAILIARFGNRRHS